MINVFVAAGLLCLYYRPEQYSWAPPFRASWPIALVFFLSNVYLVVAPFVPPSDGQSVYESLPYYLHCLVGIAILVAGAIYWVVWAQVLPRLGKYELVRETVIDELDGREKSFFTRKRVETTTKIEY